MPRTRLCALLLLCLAAPGLAFSSVSFSNHTQTCDACGDNFTYHADLNNDGHEDLAYIYGLAMGGYPSFVVKFSNGAGSYSSGTFYQTPLYDGSNDSISALALGDFNHDGSIDIVAFTIDSGKAYVYLNNGAGKFTLSGWFQYAQAGGTVGGVSATVGDFNRDGYLDLAFVFDGQLHLWLGNGKGGFTSGLSQNVHGNDVTMGDFDGDGLADLLIYGDPAAISTAYVYYGDGTGHFSDAIALSLPKGYAAFSAGDVNSDGKTDVLATDPTVGSSRIYVFYGDSSRKFASRTNMLVGRCVAAQPVKVADLDGNGFNDLIVEEKDCQSSSSGPLNATGGPLYVDVLTRNPDSSYNPDQTLYWPIRAADGGSYEIAQPPVVLNANGDFRPDLLVQECADAYCGSVFDTTQINTTTGLAPTCHPPATSEGIMVCAPYLGGPVNGNIDFLIGAAGPVIMRDVEVWVDGTKRAEQLDGFSYYTHLLQFVILGPGEHRVDVYGAGWDQSTVHKSFTVDVK
jgi:hypothetical protein